jgi:hypothetical protein
MFQPFKEAFALLARTTPYLVMRLGVYTFAGVVIGIYWLVIGLIAWVAGKILPVAGIIVFIIGLAANLWLWRLLREYMLYIVKAGHIAVIAELVSRGKLPEGEGQVAFGKRQVTERFGQASGLFAADQLVKAIIAALNRTLFTATAFLPFLRGLAQFAQLVVDRSLTYIDEAILARTYVTGERNIWESARQGIILYGMNWKPILKTAVLTALIGYFATAVIFVIFLGPALAISALLPPAFRIVALVIAAVFAFTTRLALVEPFAMTATLVTYLRSVEGQVPDPAWEARIASLTGRFGELKAKAGEFARGSGGQQPGPAPAFAGVGSPVPPPPRSS